MKILKILKSRKVQAAGVALLLTFGVSTFLGVSIEDAWNGFRELFVAIGLESE